MGNPNPIAFTILGVDIRWYGILIAVGMALALSIAVYRGKRKGFSSDDITDVVLFAVPMGIIGARLYYCIFNWGYYGRFPEEIFNIRAGGLAIHGGLILGILTAFVVCKIKKIDVIDFFDLCAPCVALAQSIGRWGNYFNSEAHGGPTDLPWAITVDGQSVHPTFLYESIWCFVLFLVLSKIDRKEHFKGKVICLYGILYSAERFFVESLRTDSLMIGPLKQAQVISVGIAVVSLICYVILKKKADNSSK